MTAAFVAVGLLSVFPGPAVVELADENLGDVVAQITGGGKVPDLLVEHADVFTGTEAVRQTGNERHVNTLKGWEHKVVQTPQGPGEFRYLRFAWRKEGGGTVLLAFAINNGQWQGKRYCAGPYDLGGSGVKVADVAPTEWTVVTRDLFKDFGECTLSSVLFSSANAGTAYFDHVLLGRTIADLDRHTAAALGRNRPAGLLAGAARDSAWADLMGDDKAKGMAAFRLFLAVAPEQVGYVRERLPKPQANEGQAARIRALMAELSADDFDTRVAATDALQAIGGPAVPYLQAAAERDDAPEAAIRSGTILRRLGIKAGETTPGQARAARVVRLLERAGTAEARDLLEKLAEGAHGPDYPAEARAAVARLKPPQ